MTRKLTTSSAKPMSDEETKMMWSLHGSIFYIGIRKSVSRRPAAERGCDGETDRREVLQQRPHAWPAKP
jgi:hypothetical protein